MGREPPSDDAHREETFALVHPTAPHYNTLLGTEPTDQKENPSIGWRRLEDHAGR